MSFFGIPDLAASRYQTEKCVEFIEFADVTLSGGAEVMSRQEDSDDGVMPVTFSDSDWERLSYDEDSQPPSFDPDLEAGSGQGDYEEEDVAPCEGDPDDELEHVTAPFDGDEDVSENMIIADIYESGIVPDRSHTLQNVDALCQPRGERSESTGLLLTLLYVIHDFFQPRLQWFFDSMIFRKYLADNATLSSALITATIVMVLPLAAALILSAFLVACSAAACAFLVVVSVGLGIVLSLVWAFWVSVPITILLAALCAGSTLYQRTFKVKLSAKEV